MAAGLSCLAEESIESYEQRSWRNIRVSLWRSVELISGMWDRCSGFLASQQNGEEVIERMGCMTMTDAVSSCVCDLLRGVSNL